MNILHISRTMGQGGAEKVVYQICKDAPSDYKMIIASTGGYYVEELAKNNIKHYTIPDIDQKNPLYMIKTYFTLKKIIKKEKIDVIHSHHRMAAFYSRIICLFRKKIKRVYTSHNVFYNKKRLLNFSLKGSKIIAVGQGVKDNLIDYFKISSNKISIIYNSIEKPVKLNPLKDNFILNKKKKIYIGTIGRLSEQKGIDVFLKAMKKEIKTNKNIYAIVIGDGELKNDLIKLAKSLNIMENVVFTGYRKDVMELINYMDFIVLSSRWEGFPLTPIETFAMNKTIIASDICGNNEIVKNNVNGLLFNKDDIDALTEKIDYLINNQDILKTLENNAYKSYKENYSYEVFKNKYFEVYKS